jgi:ABC-type proline/glycine betaine transport system permease subunit
MVATVAARKSQLQNLLEGFALTTIFQSFPTFATAALLLKLFGNRDLVGDPGVAIFVTCASLFHALLAGLLGPRLPIVFKTVYEPKFFDGRLSLSGKITEWRIQPAASLQLVIIVLMLSVLAVVVASVE